jgi:phage baseplate assembly protein W
MIAGPRKVYDFKSVGFTEQDVRDNRSTFTVNDPIGIVSPVQFGNDADGLFAMHRNLLDQIKDNLKVLLRTNHGERPPLYDFGANLMPLAFDIGTDTGDTQAMARISKALSKYLPLVQPSDYEPIVLYEDNGELAKVGVRMTYDIPILSVTDQKVDCIIYAAG